MIWPFVPNWRDGWKETLEFRTEVITSRSGKEQRRALRSSPRRTFAFTSLADGPRLETLNAFMASRQDETITLPEVTRAIRTTAALPIGANSVTAETVPPWLIAGATVGLSHRRHQAQFVVQSVAGNVVQFTTPATVSFGRTALLSPVMRGWVQPSLTASLQTNSVSEPKVEFEVEPGSEFPDLGTPSYSWFNGRELLTIEPDWSQAPSVTYSHDIQSVDYGRGRVRRLSPVSFATRTTQLSYVGRSREDLIRLKDFFSRMKGQQGEFYMPSGQNDLVMVGDAVEGSDTLTVAGRETYDAYADSSVHRAVSIKSKEGAVFAREIETMALVSGNTVLTLVEPWAFDLPKSGVRGISWLNVCRFASDSLTIDWLTDAVGRVALNIRTLEALVSEINEFLDPITAYMLSTYGLTFSEDVIADPLQWAVNVRYPDIAEV